MMSSRRVASRSYYCPGKYPPLERRSVNADTPYPGSVTLRWSGVRLSSMPLWEAGQFSSAWPDCILYAYTRCDRDAKHCMENNSKQQQIIHAFLVLPAPSKLFLVSIMLLSSQVYPLRELQCSCTAGIGRPAFSRETIAMQVDGATQVTTSELKRVRADAKVSTCWRQRSDKQALLKAF